MKGFILCAGLGKRLRPLTEEIPKPLLPFLGKPLVQHILEKLKEAGIEEIGINLHWKPENVKEFFEKFKGEFNFHFFYEKELLDTGGALKNAKEFLRGSNFIVINSDIIFDFSLKEIIEYHKKNKNFGTLLITDNPETNNLNISKDGKLIEVSKKFSKNLKTFGGIAIYEPEILNLMEGKIFSIKEIWLKALEKNLQIDSFFIEKEKWKECGNIEN
ncbi:MAG: sugar phosphate nucleotidyltransferase, partial [Thermoanaerobaculia bacterium]